RAELQAEEEERVESYMIRKRDVNGNCAVHSATTRDTRETRLKAKQQIFDRDEAEGQAQDDEDSQAMVKLEDASAARPAPSSRSVKAEPTDDADKDEEAQLTKSGSKRAK